MLVRMMIIDSLVAVTGQNAVVVSHWVATVSTLVVVAAVGYMVILSRKPGP